MKKNILPITLITTMLTCVFSFALIIKTDNANIPVKAEMQTETENEDFTTTITVNKSNNTEIYNQENDILYTKAYEIGNDSYFSINMYNYSMSAGYQYNGEYENRNRDSNLFIAQITPYWVVDSATAQINLKIIAKATTWSKHLYYSFCTTENSETQNYINKLGWNNEIFINDTYIDIEQTTGTTILANGEKTEQQIQSLTTKYQDGIAYKELEINLNNIVLHKNTPLYLCGFTVYVKNTEPTFETLDETKSYINKLTITGQFNKSIYSYEVIDIAGLMFNILSMPFAFISQAFNLTLFAGTPYQINISNVFLGIIAVSIFLWILKLILGKADIGQFLGEQKAEYKKASKQKKEKPKEDK